MNGVNLRRFEFDYDATWTAFFTDAKLNVYSRYGGRDQGDPEARLSKPSLLHTMKQVLAAHEEVRALRAAGKVFPFPAKEDDGTKASGNEPSNSQNSPNIKRELLKGAIPLFQPIPEDIKKPEEMSLLKKGHQGCIHCHQVKEYSFLQAFHDGRFERELLFTFPYPEALGIEINRHFGHRVATVRSESPAVNAGFKADDEIVQIDNVPVRSELDIRWALHRLPQATTKVTVLVRRSSTRSTKPNLPDSPDDQKSSSKQMPSTIIGLELGLPNRWRESELGWRKSSRSIPVDWGFRAAPMTASQRRDAQLPADGVAIRILSVKPRGIAAILGLQKDDVLVAVDGEKRVRTLEQVRSDILRRFSPGDEIRLTIRRGEETLELKGKFPPWFTEETSVP